MCPTTPDQEAARVFVALWIIANACVCVHRSTYKHSAVAAVLAAAVLVGLLAGAGFWGGGA